MNLKYALYSLALLGGLLFLTSDGWGDGKGDDPPPCPGAGYQAKACDCPAEGKCEDCPCEKCSADETCACIVALKEGAGTISGVLQNRWAKKYPMVVYLDAIEGASFEPPKKNPVMDQKNLMFMPRVMPILTGTSVTFKNNDTVTHNVFSPSGEKYDLGNWDQGGTKDRTFGEPGVYTQLCKLHAEMVAYILVLETPYFAKTSGTDGAYEIPNVPAGKYTLRVWGERLKKRQLDFAVDVEVKAGETAKVDPKP